MQVSSINSYQQVSTLQQNNSSYSTPATTTKAQSPEDLFTLSPLAQNKMDAAKDIMSKYDVRNMSFNSLEKMSSELRDAGLMTDQEWAMMNAPNNNKSSLPDLVKTDMNKPVDIIATFEKELEAKKRLGQDEELLVIDKNRLKALRFFDSLS